LCRFGPDSLTDEAIIVTDDANRYTATNSSVMDVIDTSFPRPRRLWLWRAMKCTST